MIISQADKLGQVKEYYFSVKLKRVAALRKAGHEVLNLGIGSPDLPPAPEVRQAAIEAIQRDDVHGYQSYVGLPELRAEMATYLTRCFDVQFDPANEILPLIGSKEGITHISQAFLNPGDKVLVPNPGYPAYAAVTDLAMAEMIPYDLLPDTDWEPDWDFLESIEPGSVKMLWTNYPNMPTGAQGHLGIYERLVDLAKRKRFLIVNDNPYFQILNDQYMSIFQVQGAKDVALELHSLSKSHNLAGWRVGWLAGNAEYLGHVLRVKSNVDSGCFYGIQQAAIKAMQLGPEWFGKLNESYGERRTLVHKIMDALGATYDPKQVGMFIWAKLPPAMDAESLVEDLLENKHIFITPGFIFGSQGEGYIRISLCSKPSVLLQALERLQ